MISRTPLGPNHRRGTTLEVAAIVVKDNETFEAAVLRHAQAEQTRCLSIAKYRRPERLPLPEMNIPDAELDISE